MMPPVALWGRPEDVYEPTGAFRDDELGLIDPATEKPPPVDSEPW